ncbi:ArsR/SmtB family transcription factor [Kiloniella spongiae]|uniref:ArsR/SmtB family transcription factor n=1 Tax=Kiloniella spongiae TaxID=1489064 RepID=UPI0009E586D8|nr:helix-turn-helix domain-containing protein [Kiloniella spongiae]
MNSKEAIAALLALGQKTRLDTYRLLVEQGPVGLPVTEISTRLDVNISTMSRHLGHLQRTGLLRSWRFERQIIYAVEDNGIENLIGFLTENCCRESSDACKRTASQCNVIKNTS